MSGNNVLRRTPDGGKSKNNMSTPSGGGHNNCKRPLYNILPTNYWFIPTRVKQIIPNIMATVVERNYKTSTA